MRWADDINPDPWQSLWLSFERALRAEGKQPRTLETYREAAVQYHRFLLEGGIAVEPGPAHRPVIIDFLGMLAERYQPATVKARYVALRAFHTWLEEEGEVERSPMFGLKPPAVDEPAPEVLMDTEIKALLKACEGKEFEDRRDMAILRLLLDSGARRSEIAGIKLVDLNIDQGYARVIGKGGRDERILFGNKTAAALDRYLRERSKHKQASSPYLFIAQRGALTSNGIYQIVERRARLAGLTRKIHPHIFRHTLAHNWKSAGGSEEALMAVGRWRDAKSMRRYGRSVAEERARAAHRQLALGDRF